MADAPRRNAAPMSQADREARNPFYRWMMHLGLPLGLAILLHVGVLSAAALVGLTAAPQQRVDVGEYEAGLQELDLTGGLDFSPEPVMAEEPEDFTDLEETSFSDLTADPVELPDAADVDLGGSGDLGFGRGEGGGLIGIGGGAGEAGTGGFGSGMGSRMRIGSAGVWNLKVAANHVAYVVDFSGSIITVEEELKRELKRSIGRLRPSQTFNVILFYGRGSNARTESFAPSLVPANDDNKAKFVDWIGTRAPQGGTEPLGAVRRGLAMRPEAIFFFSDGEFENAVVDEIAAANRQTEAQIVSLLFDVAIINDGSGLAPQTNDQVRRMRNIAEQNLGRSERPAFKVVTFKDVYGQ